MVIKLSKPRLLKPLSQPNRAYLAGLIDGEGTVTLSRKHKNENRQLCVSISSAEFDLVDFARSCTGVGKITNKGTSKSHHTPSYTFSVYNRQALDLLQAVQPFLKSYKQKRSALILENYLDVTPRNGKYSPEQLDKKHAFEKAVLSIKANSNS
jgi:hypothetical protein